MSPPLKVCLTFDLDCVEHTQSGRKVDEFDEAVPLIKSVLAEYPGCRASWFVRIDDHVAVTHGRPDFALHEHKPTLRSLQSSGHELGWHLHSYLRQSGKWIQCTDENHIVEELHRHAPTAQAWDMRAFRMGWAFQTNRTIRAVANLGFHVDSSALPRPSYNWEEAVRDWTHTPSRPYFPSCTDYRISGSPHLPILEIPISAASIPAPYDEKDGVIRYINLAFHPEHLRDPLHDWIAHHDHLVTITHPYELMPRDRTHGLLSFRPEALCENLDLLLKIAAIHNRDVQFLTISEYAQQYKL